MTPLTRSPFSAFVSLCFRRPCRRVRSEIAVPAGQRVRPSGQGRCRASRPRVLAEINPGPRGATGWSGCASALPSPTGCARPPQSMAELGFFAHEGYDGSAFWQRIRPNYPPPPGRSWGVGRTWVWAAPKLSPAQDAIDDWLASPPHRKNMLSPTWREVGLGAVRALAAPGRLPGARRDDPDRRLRRQIAPRALRFAQAPVAQGTERRPSKPRVGGSNPPRRTRRSARGRSDAACTRCRLT